MEAMAGLVVVVAEPLHEVVGLQEGLEVAELYASGAAAGVELFVVAGVAWGVRSVAPEVGQLPEQDWDPEPRAGALPVVLTAGSERMPQRLAGNVLSWTRLDAQQTVFASREHTACCTQMWLCTCPSSWPFFLSPRGNGTYLFVQFLAASGLVSFLAVRRGLSWLGWSPLPA